MVLYSLPFYLFTLLPLFTSCSEEDDTAVEYANWQAVNEAYFEEQYQQHRAANNATSFVLKAYSKGDSLTLDQVAHTDCILVDVLPSDFTVDDERTTSPIYTGITYLHYRATLLPSLSYPSGYEFDSSYLGTFSPDTSQPTVLSVDEVIVGFATALQHMHRGDHWLVTVPYQLGYGTSGNTSVPGYSTLKFEIRLVDFSEDD